MIRQWDVSTLENRLPGGVWFQENKFLNELRLFGSVWNSVKLHKTRQVILLIIALLRRKEEKYSRNEFVVS